MKARACLLIALLAPAMPAPAVSINLVYQDPSDPFFTTVAKATMDKAAADVSFAITTTLNALTQDVYTGVNGSTNAVVNWSMFYTNPTNGATVNLPTFSLAFDTINLYIGSRNLGGTLGVGGPGGVGYNIDGSGFASEWAGAVENMEAASNAGMVRGGPVQGAISGVTSGAPHDLSYGYSIGTLAINSTLTWNKDYDVLPTENQNDLYSVAVHEMLHAIGFGIGSTWNEHVNGINWNGPAVLALLETETEAAVLTPDGEHIAEGLTGTPLVNGVFQIGQSQEALMDPTLTVGTRKYITDLDLAFLQDMGWDVQAVPEPAAGLMVLAGGLACLSLRNRRRQVPAH